MVLGPLVVAGVLIAAMTGAGAEGAAGALSWLLAPLLGVGVCLAVAVGFSKPGRRKHNLRLLGAVCGVIFATSLLAVNIGPEEGPELFWWIFVAFGMFTVVPIGLVAFLTSLFVRGE